MAISWVSASLIASRTWSPVSQALFAAARESFLLFQHATTVDDLPGRFAHHSGLHLDWSIHAPDLLILAPDLRSERTRRDIME